ncbi:MAG: hypothetical protein WBM38_13950 [Arenicellales bacterium]|jgi:hypothetical protein
MASIVKTPSGTYNAIIRKPCILLASKKFKRNADARTCSKAMSSAQEHLLLVCLRYFRTDVECY